ncbi:MAG: YraN family protein [Solirubrobacterales bacterium]
MNTKLRDDRRGRVGQLAEQAVSDYATGQGWHVVARNVHWREGEIDLIALDDDTLVFAEVKALVGRGPDGIPPFSPFDSITPRKRARIRLLARRWLTDDLMKVRQTSDLRFTAIRFDAFAVTVMADDRSIKNIEHAEDAF